MQKNQRLFNRTVIHEFSQKTIGIFAVYSASCRLFFKFGSNERVSFDS
ncbi:hypothetical protein CUZ96_1637 [Enterococcus lactis]|nr:hypothetical protein [Enterococcus lactis]MBL5011972.1 hypothetical protein [Enterococcus lactis]